MKKSRVVVEFDAVGELEGEEDGVANLAADVASREVVAQSFEVWPHLYFLDPILVGLPLVVRGPQHLNREVLPQRTTDIVLYQ